MKSSRLFPALLLAAGNSAFANYTYTYASGGYEYFHAVNSARTYNDWHRPFVRLTFAEELAEGVNHFSPFAYEPRTIDLLGVEFFDGIRQYSFNSPGVNSGGKGSISVTDGQITDWQVRLNVFSLDGEASSIVYVRKDGGALQTTVPVYMYVVTSPHAPGNYGVDYRRYYSAGSLALGQFYAGVVPEPSTYAMMLAGLAMAGWVARRKSKRV